MGEANRAFEEQAKGHAATTEKLKQEAIASREEIANYLSAKQTAESLEARDSIAEMLRASSLREEEVGRLLAALQSAGYGVQTAAREARWSPPRSSATSSPLSVI